MNLVFNNRTGDYYHDWYDIACKGTGKIISEVAKELWGKTLMFSGRKNLGWTSMQCRI